MPHGMCYSDLGNGVCNGVIFIMQQGFISGCYKINSIGQAGKILVMAMIHYLKNKVGVVDFANAQGVVMF